MDIFATVFLHFLTFMCGALCMFCVIFLLLMRYLESGPLAERPSGSHYGSAVLPEDLTRTIKCESANFGGGSPKRSPSQGNENLAINLTLQFLFNELRKSERVHLWLYRKLNSEFKELMTQTTTGKLFESVQLRNLNLGTRFPTIKGLDVAEAKINDSGLLETLDLALDLHYSGNFEFSIDLKMKLNKTAYLALQVKEVSGKARLQFTRVPYTHWSLSFYTEPVLEIEVQSHFQGRQLQPHIISIITNQIRRAVKRKHTLPRYKMRYKPFFRRLNDEDVDLSEVASTQLTPGCLEVVLREVSRLNLDCQEDSTQTEIYCTMSVDFTPWVYLTSYNGVPYMVLDLIVSKTSTQQLGVVFRQEYVTEINQSCVLVETIVAGSPAAIAEMRKGDILIAVNGRRVSNMSQVAKLVKSAAQRRFIIRVERRYRADERQNSERNFMDDRLSKDSLSVTEGTSGRFDGQIKFSELKDYDGELTEPGNKLRRRKSSAYNNTDEQQPQDSPARRVSTVSNISGISNVSQHSSIISDEINSPSVSNLCITTSQKAFASLISFDEMKNIQVDSDNQFLNIGVWAKSKSIDSQSQRLLGYINVPIKLILAQCSTSATGHYLKCHALLPPDLASSSSCWPKLQGYSGFYPELCYGDILISYGWASSDACHRASVDLSKKETSETLKSQTVQGEEAAEKKSHDFIRTHFHRATSCDFCTKKIWLKDAVQCRDCGMVCHKKCEARCQLSTVCGEIDETESAPDLGPEISLTSCEDHVQQGASMGAVKASITNTLLGLKKAGSTSNLAPPNSGGGLASRSLPPSPCASRKNSLVGGLGINPDLLEGAEPSVAAPLLAGDLDDGLMSRARDTGKYLFNSLDPEERVSKINMMIGKLKIALDLETTSRYELTQGDANSAKTIAQSDLRVQALSILLLHFCAGLQHAQEVLDRPKLNVDTRLFS